MKRFFLFLILLCFVFSQLEAKPSPVHKQIQNLSTGSKPGNYAYTINIPGKKLPDGSYSPAQIYNIYRVEKSEYLPASIHIKTKNKYSYSKEDNILYSSTVMASLKDIGISKIKASFENTPSGDAMQAASAIGLDRIYEINYTNGEDPFDVCRKLMENPEIEYATPIYYRHTFDFSPNDPQLNSEWAVATMELKKAWGITKGSKDVLIAIVDSGVDWNHEDLKANIWTNPKETAGNGKDDDGNGKKDDIHGWDFIGNISPDSANAGAWKEDNDPTNIPGFHGTHVAGCAAAVGNNSKGIAGMGFNCSILPVKCGSEQIPDAVLRGYDGIKYAADMGADIINCSWGGTGFSPVEQNVIDYAYNKGSLVIVAAGNNGSNLDVVPEYPACFTNLLCVGATMDNDQRAGFSDFGMKVDVYAPGYNILSTMPSNSYGNESGTSMSTPLVSGVAGLVKTVHPDWTPRQIIRQLRSTCDNVLTTDTSARPYLYGRVNAYKAVSYNSSNGSSIPGLEVSAIKFNAGDALTTSSPTPITLSVKNYLGDAKNTKITLLPFKNYLTFPNSTITVGDINGSQTKDVDFSAVMTSMNPWYSGMIKVLVVFESDGYKDYQVIEIPVRVNSDNNHTTVQPFSDAFYSSFQTAVALDDNNVWAAMAYPIPSGGGFLRYSNGSVSMNRVSSDSIFCISPLSSSTAYAGTGTSSGSNAYVMKTTDMGNNWSKTDVSTITTFINEIKFFDANNGIILGDPKSGRWGVATTSNGGTSWTRVSSIPNPSGNETGFVGSVAWLDNSKFWFGTSAGRVFRTSDGGKSWSVGAIQGAAHVNKIAFKDDKSGIAIFTKSTADNAPSYLATTGDGGATWIDNNNNLTDLGLGVVYAFSVEGSNKIFILTFSGETYSTSDNGATWQAVLGEEHGLVGCGAVSAKPGRVRLWNFGQNIGYLDFKYDVANPKKDIQLLSGPSLSFDSLEVQKSKTMDMVVKNTGNVDITVSNPHIIPEEGADSTEYKIWSSTISAPIQPGQTAYIRVKFSPKNVGFKKATLEFDTDVDGNPRDVSLTGYAIPSTSISLTILNIDPFKFDTVLINKTKSASVNIYNPSNSTVSITKCVIKNGSGTDSTEFSLVNSDQINIQSNETANIPVQFSPKTIGKKQATFEISFNDKTQTKTKVLNLSGYGANATSIMDYDEAAGIAINSISPNPAQSDAKLGYSLRNSSLLELSVLNEVGETVAVLFKGTANAGAGSINVPTGNLTSGVYFIRLNAEGKSVYKKFVIQK